MLKKAVFMDLDDTLLDSKKQISRENKEAIEKAAAQGNAMVICSGRPVTTVLPIVHELGFDRIGGYAICFNGALIYDCRAGKVLCGTPMDPKDIDLVFQEADRLGIHCHAYDSHGMVSRSMDKETKYYMEVTGIDQRTLPSLPDGLTEPAYKLLALSLNDKEILKELKRRVLRKTSGRISCFFSNDQFLEFSAYGIDKGAGIRQVCALLNIPLSQTIGIGDSENDVPMLSVTGLSCCMANGNQECKGVSHYITKRDCNHSGVAEVIKKFVLEAEK